MKATMQTYLYDVLEDQYCKICELDDTHFRVMYALSGEKSARIPKDLLRKRTMFRKVGKSDMGKVLKTALAHHRAEKNLLQLEPTEDYPPLTSLIARIETYFRDMLQIIGS